MSNQMLKKALSSDISGSPKMTLIAIAHNSNSQGYACLTLQKIAYFIGRNERTVMRCIAELEKSGLLRVVKDKGQPSHYFLEGMGGEK